MPRTVAASRISRPSPRTRHPESLPPFARWPAFPAADYYEGSVAVGLAPCRRSHVLGHQLLQRNVGASFGPLRNLIGFRPSTESSGGNHITRRESMAPPDVVAEDVLFASLGPGVQAV